MRVFVTAVEVSLLVVFTHDTSGDSKYSLRSWKVLDLGQRLTANGVLSLRETCLGKLGLSVHTRQF